MQAWMDGCCEHASGTAAHSLPAKRKPILDLGPRGGLRAAFSRGLEIHKAANTNNRGEGSGSLADREHEFCCC